MLSSKTKRELKIDQRKILIDSIEIGISSPQQILTWGERVLPNGKKVGLIKNSKTVNYKRFTPFRDGLFCERIFGPVTSFVCACGKKQPHNKVSFCEKCEVEYIDQRSRRYRLGYISLISPVTHIWYLKGRPSYLSLFLGKRKKTILALAYCNAYLIEHGHSKKEDLAKSSNGWLKNKSLALKEEQDLLPWQKDNPLDSKVERAQVYKANSEMPHYRVKRVPVFLSTFRKTDPERCSCSSKTSLCSSTNAYNCLVLPYLNRKGQMYKTKQLQNRVLLEKASRTLLLRSKGMSREESKQKQGSQNCFNPRFTQTFWVNRLSRGAPLFFYRRKRGFFMPLQNKALHNSTIGLQALSKKTAQGRAWLKSKIVSSLSPVQCFAKRAVITPKLLANFCTRARLTSDKCNYKTPFCRAELLTKLCFVTRARLTNTSAKLCTRARRRLPSLLRSKSVRSKSDAKRFVRSFVRLPSRARLRLPSLLLCKSVQSKSDARDAMPCKSYSKVAHVTHMCKSQNEKKKEKCKICTKKKVSSYGSYPYTRQHTLPFLPSLASHFYLRDALLTFIYSLAAYEDFPLMEYCHTHRREPLRDVHRFMAHKTVDSLKKSFSCGVTDYIKSFSRKLHTFEELRGYKPDLRQVRQDLFEKRDSKHFKKHVFVNQGVQRKKIEKKIFRDFESAFLIQQEPSSQPLARQDFASQILTSLLRSKSVRSFGQKRMHRIDKKICSASRASLLLRTLLLRKSEGRRSLARVRSKSVQSFARRSLARVQSFAKLRFARDENLQKKNLSEESKRSALSGLELTAICEILSYTGGGALQQLLQQLNQYDLCKFLFAEAQILRVLYETQVSTGLNRRQEIVSCECNPFLQAERFSSVHRFDPFSNVGSGKRKKRVGSNPKKIDAEKSLYDDFQNNTPDLQKKQILRISRRIYKVARRLKITQLLTRNHRKPEWMILSNLPVLPPDLRPILQMSEKVIVASDLNVMYQRVIYRNNRHLRVRFIDFHLVTAIQRLVQDAVDRLIENGKGGSKPYYTQGGRPLKSLSDILKGKKGRFRLNLLGKRVDFSGRSVIVVSPLCQIHECGLPKAIALELYHYFLLRQLIVKKHCASIVTAKKMIKSKSSLMWDVLRELMYHHPVLLNRAPTLHRLGIQAFQPKLVLGNAILLHPLVCSGFNADFDGDQMGVHLPLSFAARAESWDLLWSRNNLLSPATGQPMLVPSQDMVLGFYYMTAQALQKKDIDWLYSDRYKEKERAYSLENRALLTSGFSLVKKSSDLAFSKTKAFLNSKDITRSFQRGKIKLHEPIWVHWNGKIENEEVSQKPLEIRVQTFGLQQSVYEGHVSSNLFVKTRIVPENDSWKTNLVQNEAKVCRASQKHVFANFCKAKVTHASLLQGTRARHTKPDTKLRFGRSSSSLDNRSFFISTKLELYCVRTTAGRVLMNNIFAEQKGL